MKNITLKAGQELKVHTPNGELTIGVYQPYMNPVNTLLYTVTCGKASKVTTLAEIQGKIGVV
jgi:hypothetical protein